MQAFVDVVLVLVFLVGLALFLTPGPAMHQFQGGIIMVVAILVLGFNTVTRALLGLRSDLAAALRAVP